MLFVGIGFSFVFKHSSLGDLSPKGGFPLSVFPSYGGILYCICMMYVIMGGLDYSIHTCIFPYCTYLYFWGRVFLMGGYMLVHV